MQNKIIVAAFDFDGTITTRDTLLPFLFYTSDFLPTIKKLLKLSPEFLKYVIGKRTRQQIKESLLTTFFSGMPMPQLRELGKAFASSTTLKKLMRPEALKRIAWHKEQGHTCILVSASTDIYLKPWSRLLGFTHVICSEVEVDGNNAATGKLEGLNCRCAEKTLRIQQLLGPRDGYYLYVYGDSRGDKEMLELADDAFYREIP